MGNTLYTKNSFNAVSIIRITIIMRIQLFIIVAGAAGEIGFSDKAFWAADDCFTVVCPENVFESIYLPFAPQQSNQLASKSKKGEHTRLSRSAIENLVIPLPPLDVQREIVPDFGHHRAYSGAYSGSLQLPKAVCILSE